MSQLRRAQLGQLSCQIVEPTHSDSPPKVLIILCHGFGAPGTDLVPLAGELSSHFPAVERDVAYVFPAGPVTLDEFKGYDARAWWPINMQQMAEEVGAGNFRALCRHVPDGLPTARAALIESINAAQQMYDRPTRLVLGGFSQGAMLALDTAFHLKSTPDGLCLWSGTVICEKEWRALAVGLQNCEVFQSHGRQDPLLPFAIAETLRDLLRASGLPVDFLPFDGMHTIPGEAIVRVGKMLTRLATNGSDDATG